jgi:hypothetical protein
MDDVSLNPKIRRLKDTAIPKRGPAKAKSNRELKFGGGDSKGVIVPVKPSWSDGIKLGGPTLNCDGRRQRHNMRCNKQQKT